MKILSPKVLITVLSTLLIGWVFASQAYSNEELTRKCDALAGEPFNPETPGLGVNWEDINALAAIKACKKAVESNPTSARLQSQLGRALDKGQQYNSAGKWFRKAALQDYTPALFNIGVLYAKGGRKRMTQ